VLTPSLRHLPSRLRYRVDRRRRTAAPGVLVVDCRETARVSGSVDLEGVNVPSAASLPASLRHVVRDA